MQNFATMTYTDELHYIYHNTDYQILQKPSVFGHGNTISDERTEWENVYIKINKNVGKT